MAQGISPNNLNKISQVYLSQISEHHKKDADGNTIPHEDENIGEAKVDNKIPDYKRSSARNARYGNPYGSLALGGGIQRDRRDDHYNRRGKKTKGVKNEEAMDEASYTGPDKEDRKQIKKMDNPSYAKKLADYEKNMDPKKRQELKDKATKGMKFTHEGTSYGMYKGSGEPSGAMAAFGKKKKEKKKVKMEGLSNWKEDYVWEQDEEEMEKEIKEKKVKNKIIINPKLGEAVEELGGELIDVQEMNGEKKEEDPQMKSKMLRQRQLKKQVLLRKLQAVRQTGGEDIVASYEPEGEQLDEYGDPKVGVKLRVARAIDRVNPKPKVGSKRTAMSNALKMSSIKGETKRRKQKENPYSIGKKMKMVVRSMSEGETIDEEGYDIARDMGKVPPTKDKKDATTMSPSKEMMKTQKPMKGKSALDLVKADIRKKMGKGAIMDMGKK